MFTTLALFATLTGPALPAATISLAPLQRPAITELPAIRTSSKFRARKRNVQFSGKGKASPDGFGGGKPSRNGFSGAKPGGGAKKCVVTPGRTNCN